MALTCKQCGGPIRANKEKLAVVVGGSATLMLLGMMAATPVGWVALISAAWAGSAKAKELLRVKQQLTYASQKAGSYFWCDGCPRHVPIGEVFGG